jgi:hypothetical protein
MIDKLNRHLEEKVLGGLDLKRESVAIDVTERDYERLNQLFKIIHTNVTPMHSVDQRVKVYNYNGVVLRVKIGNKTSGFLK